MTRRVPKTEEGGPADQGALLARRLAAVFLLGVVLFIPPVFTVFTRLGVVGGVPVLLAYVFGAWAAVIVALVWATRGGKGGGDA